MKNVFLVGFMGTGKTMVAKALARAMGRKYVSTDDLIEEREKRKINDIFRDEGEPYFRKAEKAVIAEISERDGQVVDAGGGAVLDGDNLRAMGENGIIICLWADPRTIYDRTKKHGHRPLLNVEDPMGKIKELLDERRPFYEKADFHVDTALSDPDAVVEQVKRIVDEAEKEKE